MVIHEAAENYLETIYMIRRRASSCRSVDVAAELGYSKPTVSVMMKNLRENGHITVTTSGFISLTESGRAVADMIFERHEMLTSVLIAIGVPANIASEDACRIEHVISPESFEAIKTALAKHHK